MYSAFVSPHLEEHLRKRATALPVPNLFSTRDFSSDDHSALLLTRHLYEAVQKQLGEALALRARDRRFIDERTRAMAPYNATYNKRIQDAEYKTPIGLVDGDGRVVFGPRSPKFSVSSGRPIAPVPAELQGYHVTLFGVPESRSVALQALYCMDSGLPDEPPLVAELAARGRLRPFWGADTEDSKTPLEGEIEEANAVLTSAFHRTLAEEGHPVRDDSAKPIKRLPGIAIPSLSLFFRDGGTSALQPIPLHIYDLALHLDRNWQCQGALTFYIPKMESEEEAAYWCHLLTAAEAELGRQHSTYRSGTIRVIVVLENARAIFRVNEIMDALEPFFVGASLGWHDFLASAARWMKEDPQYQIPVKADPHIVVDAIRASHLVLRDVVGPRGGIKIGGMYGVLPVGAPSLRSPSFQVTLKGFLRDLLVQLRRGLDGVWIARPDFMRLGTAVFTAWQLHQKGDTTPLRELVRALLVSESDVTFIMGLLIDPKDEAFATAAQNVDSSVFCRSIIAADRSASAVIPNNHPDEVRYNVFQSLQYLAEWLRGNGCVALPAVVDGVPVQVLDDLATTERSRWEVWIEVHHGRFQTEDVLQIIQEELRFIRKDLSTATKIVHVKYTDATAKWYAVAANLLIGFMTDAHPPEFVTERLLIFTLPEVRAADDPWAAACGIDPTVGGSPA